MGHSGVHRLALRALEAARRLPRGLRVGVVVLSVCVAVAGCGTKPPSGNMQPTETFLALDHHEVVAARRIVNHEVHRQQVRLTAALGRRYATSPPSDGSLSRGCPAGRLLQIVIRGSFPTEPSSIEFEELLASPSGRVCATAYRRSLPSDLANALHSELDSSHG